MSNQGSSNQVSVSLGLTGQINFGSSEDMPFPQKVKFTFNREGTLGPFDAIGNFFGSVGQTVKVFATYHDIAKVKEYIVLAGECRGESNANSIKNLFTYNINNVTTAQFAGGGTTNAVHIKLPFLTEALAAYVEAIDVKEIAGTLDRYSYYVRFVAISDPNISNLLGAY